MTCYLPTRRIIPSYNRWMDEQHHSSMPFPVYILSFHPFIFIVQFYAVLFIFLSFCAILSHDVHTIFFLFFPHSSFHHSSFLTSTRLINYFISILPAFAFAQQFFFHPVSFYPLFQFLLNYCLLLLNDRKIILWSCHFIYILSILFLIFSSSFTHYLLHFPTHLFLKRLMFLHTI
jgi:hypothetical protein